MVTKNGGYAIVSYNDSDIFAKVKNAFENEKPILFYDDDKTCFYVDSVKVNGDGDYVFTKGGKTWTVTDSNTLSSEGSVDSPTMENIKDLTGHNRFIEIEGSPLEQTGVTINYCKASLSGTHLMLVVAGTIDNAVVLPASIVFATYELPEWIADKIYTVWSNNIENKQITLFNDDWSSQTMGLTLRKSTNSLIISSYTDEFTATKIRNFRVQFDLLIDAE